MRISRYSQKIALICASLVVAIFGLSFLLYSQGPRVRFVQGLDDTAQRALSKDSSLQIVFDRPIKQRDYTDLISITPELDFSTQTNTQSITLTLHDNLSSGVEYTIAVQPDIYDKSGKIMKNLYEKSFAVAQASYMYLERNYSPQSESSPTSEASMTDANDHIKISSIGAQDEILFSHPQIRTFAANNDYAVIAVKEADNDELYTLDLHTNKLRKETLWSKGIINNLAISPRSKTALYTTRPNSGTVSSDYFAEYSNRIESLDLETGSAIFLTDSEGSPLKAFSIETDVDGQIALIQDSTQAYYALSPFNDFAPVLVGTYAETFGFSGDGTELIFRDRTELVRYDIASAGTQSIDIDAGDYILDVEPRNKNVIFSSTVYLPDSSYSTIDSLQNWTDEPQTIWRSKPGDPTLLQNFSTSYDTSLLAVQLNPQNCPYDDMASDSECVNPSLQIVDSQSREVLEQFRGIKLTWLP